MRAIQGAGEPAPPPRRRRAPDRRHPHHAAGGLRLRRGGAGSDASRVSTGPNRLLLSQLREGALELVVGRLSAPEEMTGLVFEQLYVERVAAVVRPGHPLIAAPAPGFAGFPLILPPPGAVIRPTVEQYFLSLGRELPPALVETVELAVGRGLVQMSDAVWFISRGVVAEELALGTLVALELAAPPGDRRSGRPHPPRRGRARRRCAGADGGLSQRRAGGDGRRLSAYSAGTAPRGRRRAGAPTR